MNSSPLDPLILSAVRTPFGRRQGALREVRPDELLANAIVAALIRSGVPAYQVGDVVAGCVSQAGEQGANIARQAALLAGLPFEVPAVTLNRMCGSSQYAVHAAAQAIAAGQVESAERIGDHWGISRADCNAFAKESRRRAHAARTAKLHHEIVPVPGVDKAGAAILLDHDEGVRTTIDHEKMAAMAPVFRHASSGVVTAANASQMSDGGAAVVLGSRAAAQRLGLKPKARILARIVVGSDPVMQLTGVMPATRLALEKAGLGLGDIDWIELNEAFATVALAWAREFEPDMDKLKPWGGAIAHGHPLGGTGAGLLAKMLSGLEARDGTFGLQVMCLGHGMATATIVQRLN